MKWVKYRLTKPPKMGWYCFKGNEPSGWVWFDGNNVIHEAEVVNMFPNAQWLDESNKLIERLSIKGGEWDFVHDKIIERINELEVDCPECETIVGSDEQYQCTECGGGSTIRVLDWIKKQLT